MSTLVKWYEENIAGHMWVIKMCPAHAKTGKNVIIIQSRQILS